MKDQLHPLAGEMSGINSDPMAEKYYGISPFVYCAASPGNLIDPVGKAWYLLNKEGYISLLDNREGEVFDVLFRQQNNGLPDSHGALKVNDQSILSALAHKSETGFVSNYSDLLSVFFFAADNTSVEWGLYSSSSGSVLRTDHNNREVSEPSSMAGNMVAKIHSHPGVETNTKAEYNSMGFWLSNSNFDNAGNLILGKRLVKENETGDWLNYINAYKTMGENAAKSRVYFPNSRRIYQLNYNAKPSLVKTR